MHKGEQEHGSPQSELLWGWGGESKLHQPQGGGENQLLQLRGMWGRRSCSSGHGGRGEESQLLWQWGRGREDSQLLRVGRKASSSGHRGHRKCPSKSGQIFMPAHAPGG